MQAAGAFTSMAARLALFLNYDVDPDERSTPDKPISWLEKERQRRIWWCCYLIDSWLSASFARPRLIPSEYPVKLPSSERLWEIADPDSTSPPQPIVYESRPPVFTSCMQDGRITQENFSGTQSFMSVPLLMAPSHPSTIFNQLVNWVQSDDNNFTSETFVENSSGVVQPPEPDVYVHLIEARLLLTRAMSYRIVRKLPPEMSQKVSSANEVHNKDHLKSTAVGRLRVVRVWDEEYGMEAKDPEEYATDLPRINDEMKKWWDALPDKFRDLSIHSAGFQPSLTSDS